MIEMFVVCSGEGSKVIVESVVQSLPSDSIHPSESSLKCVSSLLSSQLSIHTTVKSRESLVQICALRAESQTRN